jgi:putative hemolysin
VLYGGVYRAAESFAMTDDCKAESLKDFTYTNEKAPWWTRVSARAIERLSGQPYFVNLYLSWHAAPPPKEDFFAAALRLLRIDLAYDSARLAQWPAEGPLVVVCNHPFGVIDGLSVCHLVSRRRGDFRILLNSVLNCLDEVRPYVLPVDFEETKAALAVNMQSRAAALAHVKAGGSVIVFPAGGISTTGRLFARKAEDAPWKTFVARLVREGRATVAPVFIPGQNSRFFQIASHVSMDLRLALMFRETRRLMGRRIEARLREVLPFERLASLDRAALTHCLRAAVYG